MRIDNLVEREKRVVIRKVRERGECALRGLVARPQRTGRRKNHALVVRTGTREIST